MVLDYNEKRLINKKALCMTKQASVPDNLSVSSEQIFNTLNTPYIVFDVDDPVFTIIAENEAHASVAMVKRDEAIGKPLFDVFPDTSEKFKTTGVSDLVQSLRTVIKTGKPDSMPNLNYDLKNEAGELTTKWWSVTHFPIFDKAKKVAAIYQETKDITSEVDAEMRIDSVEQELEQVLAMSLVGTWTWDIKGELVYTDSNLARMFGISKKDAAAGLPLQRFIDSIYLDDQKRVMREIEQALANKTQYETEYRTSLSDNEQRWVLARGYVDYDEDDQPATFSGVIIDITEQKVAERALKESERRLAFMADSMPQLVWITRPDGYHEYYNHQWYEYTGTEPGSTDGEGWNDLFHPDDRERAWSVWQDCLKTGNPYEIEYRLYNAPTKSYRWVIGRALPLRDDDGEISKWYGTCTDIDDQKRTEQIQTFLADASKELSSTLNYKSMLKKITKLGVPTLADWCSVDIYNPETEKIEQVSIAHIDPDKVSMVQEYRERNPVKMSNTTGVPAVIRTGETEFYPIITMEMIEQAVKDKDNLEFMRKLDLHSLVVAPIRVKNEVVGGISFASSDSGRYYTTQDLQMVNELAGRISLAMTNAMLYNESKVELKQRRELEKALRNERDKLEVRVNDRTKQLRETNAGLLKEIEKRQKIEQALQENSENLARSNRELEDFAYVASHDLQEPLRKIQAFGDLLESEYGNKLGEEGIDYLKRMHGAAARMSTLIEDLLGFSRVTTRKNKHELVDLNVEVRDVVSDLESRVQDVDGTVKVGELPHVMADPTHMRQLFQNLIGNALKFHKPDVKPIVTVKCKEKDGMYEITVADNGIGFDEKYIDRIFSVFQRLHDRSAYEGTGIGLAVCRKIAERYNGTITAKSKKGEGATFIVKLPVSHKGENKK